MRSVWIVHLVLKIALVFAMPPQQTTPRAQHIGETIKMLTDQLMEVNITSTDMVLDTRTPPRVRQQTRREKIEEPIENSHAGIAVPVDEEAILLDEVTKKMHFYKVDKPTTDSGLSTWILLSGQTSSPTTTIKLPRKPAIKQNAENKNMTVVVTDKIPKPVFKKRPTITRKPSSTTATSVATKPTTAATTTAPVEKTTKLTKIKASVLNNALQNKTKPANLNSTTKRTPTTITVSQKISTTTPSTKIELVKVSDSSKIKSNMLPLEAKVGETELANSSTTTQNPKKSRRPTNKRKKNKNRRKRPNIDRKDVLNSTNIKISTNTKEKPIGTQIYNYLSREVMPTVGVGLVGLMVTAGLASYFLYPFGALRRSYDIDRKDKEAPYFYRNEYTGGIAEEEAIGKVIAGMPSSSNYNTYTPKMSNVRYRQVDHRYSQQPQASVEKVKVSPSFNNNEEVVVQDMYVPHETYNPHYNKEILLEKSDDKQFVVGNVPKEYVDEATPVAVPEHGPRSLKLRRKRQIDDKENDIFSDETIDFSTQEPVTTTIPTTTIPELTTRNSTNTVAQHTASFVEMFKDLLHMKIKMGLELLQNTTQTLSRYISRVQKRVDKRNGSS